MLLLCVSHGPDRVHVGRKAASCAVWTSPTGGGGVQASSREEPGAAKHKPDRQAVSKTLEAHVLMPHWLKSVTQPTQILGASQSQSWGSPLTSLSAEGLGGRG